MELKQIEIKKTKANPLQPREHFDREKLKELANSIKEIGIINPITVRKQNDGYEIVSGERRWTASQIANQKTILAIIKEYKDEGSIAVESLIENTHREDLNPFEKAKFLQRIKEMENHTDSTLAKRVGMSKAAIISAMRYLKLDKRVVDKVSAGKLDVAKARSLSDLSQSEQRKMADNVEDMTWRDTEKIVSTFKKSSVRVKKAILADEVDVEEAQAISELPDDKVEAAISAFKGIKEIKEGTVKNIERLKEKPTKPERNAELMMAESMSKLQAKAFDVRNVCKKTKIVLEGLRNRNYFSMVSPKFKKDFLRTLSYAENSMQELQEEINNVKNEMGS